MKDNPNTVRECFYQDTGDEPERDPRAFKDWCEARVNEWRERVEALGYTMPCWCIGDVATGTQTYHEWLKERCGVE
jgi:hypothetical protein